MQCNKENYQVAQAPTPIPATAACPLCVCVFFLYLNAFHFYVAAELEQTHSRVRKASQVKESRTESRESQVAARNFIESEITLTMSSALEVTYLPALFCFTSLPFSLPLACLTCTACWFS